MRKIMPIKAKYVHTNLIAHDWKRLSAFYVSVFGCIPVPPERDLYGEWLDAGCGIPDARIQGVHLRLPGYSDNGPTLEIFQYNHPLQRVKTAANRPGFGHIAFDVDDITKARETVLKAGGNSVGDIVTVEIPGVGLITWAYVTDPEGNIVEIKCSK
jgi:predicted enzyme related to lactoylglutathione lyase